MKIATIIAVTALSTLIAFNTQAKEPFHDKLKDWLKQSIVKAESAETNDISTKVSENLVFSSESIKFFAFSAGSFLFLLFFLVFHPSQMRRDVLNNLKNRNIEEQAPRHISIKAHEAKH